jgi:tripartite-type tricarboxylate transporter receptor subunit TctC
MKLHRHTLSMVALAVAAGLGGTAAWAQGFPTRPIRMVVPYPPGGATDIISRTLAQKMSEDMKQQVLTDNRGGGGQIIGTEIVAKAAPDGYTVLLCSVTHSINPALVAKLPYDTARDFTPVSMVGSSALVIVSHPAVTRNMKEFLAMVKAQPGKINYASSGNGSGGHLAMELLKSMAGLDMVHVPYKGAGPAAADVVAGQAQVLFSSPLAVVSLAKAGKLRLLAISSKTRSAALPDVPTVAESGVPGYETSLWYAILGPRGLPRDVVSRMNASIRGGVNSVDLKEKFEAGGVEAQASSPEELTSYIASEMAKWKTVIDKAGIKPE